MKGGSAGQDVGIEEMEQSLARNVAMMISATPMSLLLKD